MRFVIQITRRDGIIISLYIMRLLDFEYLIVIYMFYVLFV